MPLKQKKITKASKRPSKTTWGGARANSGGRRKGAGRKRAERRLKDFASLPAPPSDALEGQSWAYQHLLVTMRQIAADERLSDRERWQQIRSTAKAMSALMPRARLRQAEKLILEALEREKAVVDPRMEPAPKRARTKHHDDKEK